MKQENKNCILLLHYTENPESITIIKSGCDDMYHIIYEDPELGDLYHKYEFISKQELIKKFPTIKL